METALVSVIIPVYNTEQYLDDCLKSICGQTYRNLEILLIDDASSDNSLEVCRKWAKEDSRIRILLPEDGKNHGVSIARNRAIEESQGEYLLFIDSDDIIHPRYTEWLLEEMQDRGADIGGFSLIKVETEEDFEKIPEYDADNNEGSFEFYGSNVFGEVMGTPDCLSGIMAIGGKCVLKASLGEVRFKTGMKYGEDTLFIQDLAKNALSALVGRRELYYYRMHDNNAIKKKYQEKLTDQVYYYFDKANQLIKVGDIEASRMWQEITFNALVAKYQLAADKKDKDGKKEARKLAKEVIKQPYFGTTTMGRRFNYTFLAFCPTGWFGFRKCINLKNRFKSLIRNSIVHSVARVGIITFHCADNVGAMLQSFGLKNAITDLGFETDIINYCPKYMTGRHRFFSYIPEGDFKKRLKVMLTSAKWHLKDVGAFTNRRKNMRLFRRKVVRPYGSKKYSPTALIHCKYNTYVVGSDQIWNPDLTYGLRPEYFGKIHKKDRVIAYAASLGGPALSEKYSDEFQELIKPLRAVSMREESSVEWVQKRYQNGLVKTVCDPTFLPAAWVWDSLVKRPKLEIEPGKFVFVYTTEIKPELDWFAVALAEKKGLKPVIMSTIDRSDAGYITDCTAGPAEFLWYVKNAAYVVSNSFHGLAFSVIMKKQFVAFLHSNRSNRIRDMLSEVGLGNRIIEETQADDDQLIMGALESEINWDNVAESVDTLRQRSLKYLSRNIYARDKEKNEKSLRQKRKLHRV